MHPTNCLNCGSNLQSYKFCPDCGQKATTHRLSFHELWHELVHYFAHADKSIFSLVRALAVRPGVVAREYVDGRRAKYFKPVNFFLVVGTILVLSLSWFHLPNEAAIMNLDQHAASIKNVEEQKRFLEMAGRMKHFVHYATKYSNVLNMVITPLYALIFWLFYKKARYSYIEHLVANLYFISFIMLFNSLLIVPWQSKVDFAQTGVFFVLTDIIYRSFAYRQFMGKPGIGPLLKAIGVSLFTLCFWFLLSWLVLQQYILTGFKF